MDSKTHHCPLWSNSETQKPRHPRYSVTEVKYFVTKIYAAKANTCMHN